MLRIEHTASAIAVLSTISLLCSAVFNIGYFSFFGFEYIYFLSISDHVIAAIIWVPTVLFASIGIYLSGFSHQIAAKMVFRVPSTEPKRSQRAAMAIFRNSPMAVGSLSLTVATSISTGAYGADDFNIILVLSVVLIGALIFRWVIEKIRIGFSLPLVPVLLTSLVGVGFALFLMGQYWAGKDFERATSHPSHFLMQDHSVQSLGILRVVSAGLIVFDSNQQTINLVRLDSVLSVSRRSQNVDRLLQTADTLSLSEVWDSFLDIFYREN